MANAYFSHMAIESPQEASILSDEYTWTMLTLLRKSGAKGLTPMEVHEKVEKEEGVSVSRSKIYSLLKRLYEIGWVHRYWDQESKAQRNTLGPIWGGTLLDEQFEAEVKIKMMPYIQKNLFPVFEEYLKKALSDFADDSKARKWLPQNHESDLCKRCHENHEAAEFFDGLLDVALSEFIDSKNFEKFLRTKGYLYVEDE